MVSDSSLINSLSTPTPYGVIMKLNQNSYYPTAMCDRPVINMPVYPESTVYEHIMNPGYSYSVEITKATHCDNLEILYALEV